MNPNKEVLLEAKNLKVRFSVQSKGFFAKKQNVYAVNNVSFNIYKEEVLGIVGESGSGKSTVAKAMLRLLDHNSITKGEVVYLGDNILNFSEKQMRNLRSDMQIIFQDPLASLNPRMTIGEIIEEPLKVYKKNLTDEQRKEKVKKTMELVGLDINIINRYPHEFSGGQNQRVGIARAVILEPKLLVCDEAVSALDVSIKAQIINLLKDLKNNLKISILFISHDLSVVKYISDRVLVLYLGEIMELAHSDNIYNNPLHPYTKGLINSIPLPDPVLEQQKKREGIVGEIPSLFQKHVGCPFASRCPLVFDKCWKEKPNQEIINNTLVACHKVK